MIQIAMTAEQFLDHRGEMPEGGQWAELHAGVPIFLEPPDVDHGTVVLNLSKALAAYFQNSPTGYACFDLGLKLNCNPDTVLFPAVSVYLGGPMFAEMDEPISERVPNWIVDLASTRDRRHQMAPRIEQWLTWGVNEVWVIDPKALQLQIQTAAGHSEVHGQEGVAVSTNLSGFSIAIPDLFRVPDWAK